MSVRNKLERLLKNQTIVKHDSVLTRVSDYAEAISSVENSVAVVSDLSDGKSYIYPGMFASVIGISDYEKEDSIWEKRILDLIPEDELNEKFIAELRFFHFLKHVPKSQRSHYYLMSKLHFNHESGKMLDVLHRMYYIFDNNADKVRFAICVYGHQSVDFKGKS